MKNLVAVDQEKVKEYMRNYIAVSPRVALTVMDDPSMVDLSPSNELFYDYPKLCQERERLNKDITHFDLVSMQDGEVLGLFYFTITGTEGGSFTIYRTERDKPFAFGKDVQRAYDYMHQRTTDFTVVVYLDGDNQIEADRINGRGIVHHLGKVYTIYREYYTLKKMGERIAPLLILQVQGAMT